MSKLNCILLVDDDEATNHYHKIIIKDLGITNHIQVCYDGGEALEYLTNSGEYESDSKTYPQPELIFLDINMPGLNGFDFLEEYKLLPPEQKGNRIIFMLTTSLNDDDRIRAEAYSDVAGFHNKPLEGDSVKEILKQYFKL